MSLAVQYRRKLLALLVAPKVPTQEIVNAPGWNKTVDGGVSNDRYFVEVLGNIIQSSHPKDMEYFVLTESERHCCGG